MSDILGQADKVTALFTNAAITTARNNAHQPRELEPKGFCHNCEDILDDPRKLFCDCSCGAEFDKRKNNGYAR